MEIVLLTVGKTSTPYIVEGIKEYEKRLRHYLQFKMVNLPDVRISKNMTFEMQKEAEGNLIVGGVEPSDLFILLDEHGEMPTSMQFASQMEKMMATGRKRIVFCVGGPYGFSEKVYARADKKLSLSKLTFSHEMVRLFFIEQLYRAMTILRGEPYHHE